MSETLQLYSFGKYDRSGKVRWLAYELGLTVEEHAVNMGDHRQLPFRELNPYAAIPVVKWRGKKLHESAAICTYLAEQHPSSGFIVDTDNAQRAEYLMWNSLCENTLETKLVEYNLSFQGIVPEEIRSIYKPALDFKLRTLLEQMPASEFLVADRLTLADITLAYSLRLALSAKLLQVEQVAQYLKPLATRPAAIDAEFFKTVEKYW